MIIISAYTSPPAAHCNNDLRYYIIIIIIIICLYIMLLNYDNIRHNKVSIVRQAVDEIIIRDKTKKYVWSALPVVYRQ